RDQVDAPAHSGDHDKRFRFRGGLRVRIQARRAGLLSEADGRRRTCPLRASGDFPREGGAGHCADAARRWPRAESGDPKGIGHRPYRQQLSLSAVAAEVAMSRYPLSHRFREVMGTTFRAYLLRVRLERAKALLARPEPRVTEVGMAVGLTDLSRFDKLFKRY